MANHLPDELTLMLNKNADLIEQVWAMPLGLRISTLILSAVQAHSKDIGRITGTFCRTNFALSKQYNDAQIRLLIADMLRATADEITRLTIAVK